PARYPPRASPAARKGGPCHAVLRVRVRRVRQAVRGPAELRGTRPARGARQTRTVEVPALRRHQGSAAHLVLGVRGHVEEILTRRAAGPETRRPGLPAFCACTAFL